MKKVKTIILSAFVLGILSVNLSIVSNETNGSLSLISLVKQAFAQNELPQVTCTCSSGGSGTCYFTSNKLWHYCNGSNGYYTWDCTFDGDMNHSCTPKTHS